ncbi:transglutaminase-like putative cysteine protease [Microbacterium endophyticum]|uniref:Transglutaminase-like putative cysteine protease n=1 Tax=Microbacterium endophyticum TaxID=1526412 RepID=A0A7W4YMI6_9MICO|nr:transglutaminase family protein [Microbacterium endophyticum]MBB2976238.1 transglutaminase-like putative cysteine protease [Microbacterium endophyticum]NIK35118.1 transglutaminase-like putative cysteine protease [Microbacterium endophyticum]
MQRAVTSEIDLDVRASVDLIFSITAAQQVPVVSEELTFIQDDRQYMPTEIVDQSGSRLHRFTAEPGLLQVRYSATVDGRTSGTHTSDLEAISYLRPSRYCQSDEVFSQARRQFQGLAGEDLVRAVTDFVSASVTYTPGLSLGTDSAVTTLMTGQGVCRDYAHVVIALLRAMDVPARYAACYAPGLEPMDFHAVAEAYLDGCWYAIDATRLADRRSLVRIATGRDAADCAFLSFHGGAVNLDHLRVDARLQGDDVVPESPTNDDFLSLVPLS